MSVARACEVVVLIAFMLFTTFLLLRERPPAVGIEKFSTRAELDAERRAWLEKNFKQRSN